MSGDECCGEGRAFASDATTSSPRIAKRSSPNKSDEALLIFPLLAVLLPPTPRRPMLSSLLHASPPSRCAGRRRPSCCSEWDCWIYALNEERVIVSCGVRCRRCPLFRPVSNATEV